MRSSSVLPVEILDYILSFLRHDPTSLQVCAKVNQSFHDMSDRHFYYQITLHNFPPSDVQTTPSQLLHTLHVSPHIALYIKSLRIYITSPGLWRWFRVRSLNVEDLALILPLLPQLKSLSLTGLRDGKISWHKIHSSFQAALLHILDSSTLIRVVIKEIDDFPVSTLAHCASLKHLSVTGGLDLRSDYTTRVASEKPFSAPRLESLNIGRRSVALLPNEAETKDFYPDLTALNTLTVAQQLPGDLEHITNILNICSGSLRVLEFYAGIEVDTVYDLNDRFASTSHILPPPLDLSKISNLQSLVITSAIFCEDTFWISSDGEETITKNTYSTAVPWIIQTFQTLAALLALERIVLRFTFKTTGYSLEQIDWSGLAQAMASQRFRSLRRVEFRILFERSCLEFDTGLKILKRDKYLSELIGRGLLVISKMKISELC